MTTILEFILIYILGGLTFLPVAGILLLCHALLTSSKYRSHNQQTEPASPIGDFKPSSDAPRHGSLVDTDAFKTRPHEADAAAGYFAVCREYVPRGVNGKPPERTTPAGAVVAMESPSVYQSMYRSIFDRNKGPTQIFEGMATNTKGVRRPRNVFYIVLRHGHLMLYDDVEQLEVRHVISLAHYEVDIYAGGEDIQEGELFIKRHCIRLTNKGAGEGGSTASRPFYLFSEDCSNKEDFYLALLQHREKSHERMQGSSSCAPAPLDFESAHMVKLVQQLHATEENLQTRWLNAIVGRLFLALYKTSDVEDLIRTKISKKISRVQIPAFLGSVKIRNVDMGDSAPMFTNPKLKELTLNGDLTVEVDVKYNGSFKLEIAAIARLDLGQRFRVREVNLLLAGILKRLEGHLFIRVKPPPSNRLWLSFEKMPTMELSVEPVVSARQITYGIIIRAIESKIREVVADTLVFPNWDDTPFLNTSHKTFRGGLWRDGTEERELSRASTAAEQSVAESTEKSSDSDEIEVSENPSYEPKDGSVSLPNRGDSLSASLNARKAAKSASISAAEDNAISSGLEARPRSGSKPKAMRSSSFANAATPVVELSPAVVEAVKDEAKLGQQDATAAMKDISSRSRPASLGNSPIGAPAARQHRNDRSAKNRHSSGSLRIPDADDLHVEDVDTGPPTAPDGSPSDTRSERSTAPSESAASNIDTTPAPSDSSQKSSTSTSEKRLSSNSSPSPNTTTAKKWGWGVLNRQQHQSSSATDPMSSPQHAAADTSSKGHPMGRGQPLPPPGTPLPPPAPNKSRTPWVAAIPSSALNIMNAARRKPVPGSNAAKRDHGTLPARSPAALKTSLPAFATVPRKARASLSDIVNEAGSNKSAQEGLLVVAAPSNDESAPASPTRQVDDAKGRDVLDVAQVENELGARREHHGTARQAASIASNASGEKSKSVDPETSQDRSLVDSAVDEEGRSRPIEKVNTPRRGVAEERKNTHPEKLPDRVRTEIENLAALEEHVWS